MILMLFYIPTAMTDLNSVQGDPVKIYQLGSATVHGTLSTTFINYFKITFNPAKGYTAIN